MGYELPQPGRWCTRCGARQGMAGPAWICRICVAGGPHKRIVKNPARCLLPPGTPRASERYRAIGLCSRCGGKRERTDLTCCAKCRRRLADANARFRRAHPGRSAAGRAAHQVYLVARRAKWTAQGLCAGCGDDRDRDDRKLCARCRGRAVDKQRAHRVRRRTVREDSP